MTLRIQKHFDGVWAKGPAKSTSNKWVLDMTHSQLALYWGDNPERAARELGSIRDALTFIESQLAVTGAAS